MSSADSPPHSSSRVAIDACWNRIGVSGDGSCAELTKHVHCRNCPVYSAGAARLLDGELPAGHLDEWARHFAPAPVVTPPGIRSLMVFRLGVEWLALPIAVVHEVAAPRRIHRLPHRRNGVVLGLTNVRGSLLVAVSLEAVLGRDQPEFAEASTRRLLVIERDGGRLIVPVDEVHGVHRCAADAFRDPPSTVARATATYTRAVFTWREHVVGCLDDERLFQTLNRSVA